MLSLCCGRYAVVVAQEVKRAVIVSLLALALRELHVLAAATDFAAEPEAVYVGA